MDNGNSQKTKLKMFSVMSMFLFLVDIYIIVNMKDNYTVLGIAALLTLVSVISMLNAWMKWKEKERMQQNGIQGASCWRRTMN